MSEWLNNLKYGDEVVVISEGAFTASRSKIARVSRTTATQIILDSGTRFRKADGRRVGADSFSTLSLARPTEELRAEICKSALVEKLRRVTWEKMSADTLTKVWEIAKNGQHL